MSKFAKAGAIIPMQPLILPIFLFFAGQVWSQSKAVVASPDKNITATIWVNEAGEASYNVSYHNVEVIKESKLGIVSEVGDFSRALSFFEKSKIRSTKESYTMLTAKKSRVESTANNITVGFKNRSGVPLFVEFRVSNDGVAFRYFLPALSEGVKMITREETTFHFDTTTRGYLQPMQVAKSGWQQSNPAYEEHYQQNIPVATPSKLGVGWVYPALFQNNNVWMLITESNLDSNYCGTHLSNASADGEFSIAFPDPREAFTGGGSLPRFQNSITSPWRIIAIGSLQTIVESTIGTDLAKPAKSSKPPFYVKPGKSSWSWIMSKDDSIVYSEQVRYIDFASKMNWQYCLVDADWDRKIGYDKIKALADYAAGRNVGLLLWYNSSGDWNTVKYSPKSKLLTHEDRVNEFGRLKDMGIRGVKIDFFGGDGQSVIKYYIDILNDAAQFNLLVNFHGATLPRGWQRTYPNLMTMEAIKGFEYITFTQADADKEANHCAMLPFTRNAFDPMDFTPMNLYKIAGKVQRKTTSGFELATSVLFLSGIQHFAESPGGMNHVPDYVQSFLKDLPTHWDDVRFIDGFPGKYVVIARKAGKRWYIGAINGENVERKVDIDLSKFNAKQATLITDGEEPLSFLKENISTLNQKQITMKPSGGFVLVLE